jgi:peptide/nickel transport system substrate-binding protein/oligopeptide transport system substrate-binding protein
MRNHTLRQRLTVFSSLAVLVPALVACGDAATPTVPATAPPTATSAAVGAASATPAGNTTVIVENVTPTAGAGAPNKTGGGGTLRWSNEGVQDLDTLDPALANASNSIMAASLLFEGLVRVDSKLAVQPAGAASWDISEDGKTYTFHLRPNLRWADGTAVTAEDFRWSLERALSKDNSGGSASYYLSNIHGATDWNSGAAQSLVGVRVANAQTLVIQIDKPGVYFLDQLAFTAADVVPRKLVDQFGKTWSEHAYGTGPFMLKEWKHGERLQFTPNPYYYRGSVQIDSIDMPLIPDPKTAFDLYRTGGLDIMGSQQFPNTLAATMVGQPDFKQQAQFFDAYVGFNNKKAPLDNVKLRRALALAVDKDTLTQKVLGGGAVTAKGILPPGLPGFNAGLKSLTFDAAAAKAELAAAGFADPAKVPKLTLSYTSGQSDFDKVATTLQQMWKQNLGITVQLAGVEQARFNDDLTAMANSPDSSDIEMYISVWGADYPDPQNFLSQQLRTGVGNNNGHWSDPNFDRLVDLADVERDNAKRMDLYHQAEQIAIDGVGWLPLYHGSGNLLMRPTIRGLSYTAQGLTTDDWTQVTNK